MKKILGFKFNDPQDKTKKEEYQKIKIETKFNDNIEIFKNLKLNQRNFILNNFIKDENLKENLSKEKYSIIEFDINLKDKFNNFFNDFKEFLSEQNQELIYKISKLDEENLKKFKEMLLLEIPDEKDNFNFTQMYLNEKIQEVTNQILKKNNFNLFLLISAKYKVFKHNLIQKNTFSKKLLPTVHYNIAYVILYNLYTLKKPKKKISTFIFAVDNNDRFLKINIKENESFLEIVERAATKLKLDASKITIDPNYLFKINPAKPVPLVITARYFGKINKNFTDKPKLENQEEEKIWVGLKSRLKNKYQQINPFRKLSNLLIKISNKIKGNSG